MLKVRSSYCLLCGTKQSAWVICVTVKCVFCMRDLQVTHAEPWEKGSRKTAGQTGMCGGVSRSTCFSSSCTHSSICLLPFHRGKAVVLCLCFFSLGFNSDRYYCLEFEFFFLLKVRGVGTGGIVSTAFCLLYKLFTLKLTRKQVMGLITHTDSPYIRALGFMYIRFASTFI